MQSGQVSHSTSKDPVLEPTWKTATNTLLHVNNTVNLLVPPSSIFLSPLYPLQAVRASDRKMAKPDDTKNHVDADRIVVDNSNLTELKATCDEAVERVSSAHHKHVASL